MESSLLSQVFNALIAAQDELSAIADVRPELVSNQVLEQVSDAIERLTPVLAAQAEAIK